MPDMNDKMCDKRGDPCNDLCGGAGCNSCGGLSCEKGAFTRAEKALNYAKDTERILKEKEEQAEELIRSLSQAKTNATDAWKRANLIFREAEEYYNETQKDINVAKDAFNQLTEIYKNSTASPEDIQKIAEEVSGMHLCKWLNEDHLILSFSVDLGPELGIGSGADQGASNSHSTSCELSCKCGQHHCQHKGRSGAGDAIEGASKCCQVRRTFIGSETVVNRIFHSVRAHAETVLGKAKNVVEALDAADKAQDTANVAVQQAIIDNDLAKTDLEQVI